MKRTVLGLVFCASAVLLGGTARAAVHVAVVGGSNDKVQNILAIVDGLLSTQDDIALVDRQAIRQVIAEQKLSLEALSDASQAVSVGKLLSTDIFAVLETDPASGDGPAMSVFDATTGVRLFDAALTPAWDEHTPPAIADAIKQAVKKYEIPAAQRRTVCLLAVRNVDMPWAREGFCHAAGQMLERELTNLPGMFILERKRLEQLNAERNLPGVGTGQLAASVTLIDLDIARGPDAGSVAVTAIFSDSSGKQLQTVQAVGSGQEPVKLAAVLAPLVAGALALPAGEAPVLDSKLEGRRFYREAEMALAHGRREVAAQSAATALALDPDDINIKATHAYTQIDRQPWMMLRNFGRERMSDDADVKLRAALRDLPAAAELLPGVQGKGLTEESLKELNLAESDLRQLLVTINQRCNPPVAGQQMMNMPPDFPGAPNDTPLVLTGEEAADVEHLRETFRKVRMSMDLPRFEGAIRGSTPEQLKAFTEDTTNSLWMMSVGLGQDPVENYYRVLLFDEATAFPLDRKQFVDDSVVIWKSWLDHHAGSEVRSPEMSQVLIALGGGSRPAVDPSLILGVRPRAGNALRMDLRSPWSQEEDKAVIDACAALREQAKYAGTAKYFDSCMRGIAGIARPARTTATSAPTNAKTPTPLTFSVEELTADPVLKVVPRPTRIPTASLAYFSSVRTLVDISSNRDAIKLGPPVAYKGKIYQLECGTDEGSRVWKLLRIDPDTATVSVVGQIEAAETERENFAEPFEARLSAFTPAGTINDDAYVFCNGGVTLFPLDGGPAQSIDLSRYGFSGRGIQAIRWGANKLYAAQGDCFMESDLTTQKCVTIASSRRKEKLSPLDDDVPFSMTALIGGWCATSDHMLGIAEQADGVLAFDPQTRQFTALVKPDSDADARTVVSPQMILLQEFPMLYLLDPVTDHIVRCPLPEGTAASVYPVSHAFDGKALWSGLHRFKPGAAYTEDFPALRDMQLNFDWLTAVYSVDGRRLIVSDALTTWLVEPKDKIPDAAALPHHIAARQAMEEYDPAELPDDTPNGADLPWASGRRLYDCRQSRGAAEFVLHPEVREESVYAVALCNRPAGVHPYARLVRYPLSGEESALLGQVDVPAAWQAQIERRTTRCSLESAGALGATQYVLALAGNPLMIFPLDGRPAITVGATTAPAQPAVAILQNQVYAPLQTAAGVQMFCCNVDGTGLQQVAMAANTPMPFGQDVQIPYMAADEARQRLVFMVQVINQEGDLSLNGLWSYSLQERRCKQILPLFFTIPPHFTGHLSRAYCQFWGGSVPDHDRILFRTSGGLFSFDLASDRAAPVLDQYIDRLAATDSVPQAAAALLNNSTLLQMMIKSPDSEAYRIHAFAVDEHWVWCSAGRLARDASAIQFFPPLRGRVTAAEMAPPTDECILADGGKRLLLADQMTLWVMDLRGTSAESGANR